MAGESIATAFVEIRPRVTGFRGGAVAGVERQMVGLNRATREGTRELERFGRGGVAATGVLHGLGRAASFASVAFIGGAGLVYGIRSTVEAAIEAQSVLAQTQNAVERSGLPWEEFADKIDRATKSLALLSGFKDRELLQTFQTLVRRSGDVDVALRRNALVADGARGRHTSLEAAMQIVNKASLGMVGALRRAGINIDKNATKAQALAALEDKYAGSARRFGTTAEGAQARFGVALERTQELIGTAALPAITKLMNRGADYLSQQKNQEAIQRKVNAGIEAGRRVAHLLGEAIHTIAGPVKEVDSLLGGLDKTIETVLIVGLVSKAHRAATGVGLIGAASRATTPVVVRESAIQEGAVASVGAAGVVSARSLAVLAGSVGTLAGVSTGAAAGEVALLGTNAAAATGKTKLLRGALLGIRSIGPIGATIAIAMVLENKAEIDKWLRDHGLGFSTKGLIPNVKGLLGVGGRDDGQGKLSKKQLATVALRGGQPSADALARLGFTDPFTDLAGLSEEQLKAVARRGGDRARHAKQLLQSLRALAKGPDIKPEKPDKPDEPVGPELPRGATRDETLQLQLAAAEEAGDEDAQLRILREQEAFYRKFIGVREGLLKRRVGDTKAHVAAILGLRSSIASAEGKVQTILSGRDAARKERATEYRAQLSATEESLQTAAEGATPATRRKRDDALVAFYKREAEDARLTGIERRHYANLAAKATADEIRDLKADQVAAHDLHVAALAATEERLQTDAQTATPRNRRRREDALVAFYKREAADGRLTNVERRHYANLAAKEANDELKALKADRVAAATRAHALHVEAIAATEARLRDDATAGRVGRQFVLPGQHPGLARRGNIDLLNRKVAHVADGSTAPARTISIEVDGRTVLVPTVINGRVVSGKQAIAHYFKTRENLGTFLTPQAAQAYADQLHVQQARVHAPGGRKYVAQDALIAFYQRESRDKALTKPERRRFAGLAASERTAELASLKADRADATSAAEQRLKNLRATADVLEARAGENEKLLDRAYNAERKADRDLIEFYRKLEADKTLTLKERRQAEAKRIQTEKDLANVGKKKSGEKALTVGELFAEAVKEFQTYGSDVGGLGQPLSAQDARAAYAAQIIAKLPRAKLPRRAGGGPVEAGRAYQVGERGPETFVAPVSGYIVPTPPAGAGRVPAGIERAPLIERIPAPAGVERAPAPRVARAPVPTGTELVPTPAGTERGAGRYSVLRSRAVSAPLQRHISSWLERFAGVGTRPASRQSDGGPESSVAGLPARAAGGQVEAGRAYQVGERGPETFVAPADGVVVPAAPAGAGRRGTERYGLAPIIGKLPSLAEMPRAKLADGGPVVAGRAYQVGERGAEAYVVPTPPHGMERHGVGRYSVLGSRGATAPMQRDIRSWLEQFTGRGLSRPIAEALDEWWGDHYPEIARELGPRRPDVAQPGHASVTIRRGGSTQIVQNFYGAKSAGEAATEARLAAQNRYG